MIRGGCVPPSVPAWWGLHVGASPSGNPWGRRSVTDGGRGCAGRAPLRGPMSLSDLCSGEDFGWGFWWAMTWSCRGQCPRATSSPCRCLPMVRVASPIGRGPCVAAAVLGGARTVAVAVGTASAPAAYTRSCRGRQGWSWWTWTTRRSCPRSAAPTDGRPCRRTRPVGVMYYLAPGDPGSADGLVIGQVAHGGAQASTPTA